MKKKYINPQACWETFVSEYVLAASDVYDATGADVTFDAESDFDSFFS